MSKPLRVLLTFEAYDFRIHRGVVKYAREAGWHLTVQVVPDFRVPWGWEGDGVITGGGASSEHLDFLAAAKVPVVDLGWSHPELKFPRMLNDNPTAGRQAAEHFVARGFRNFLFFSCRPGWYEKERFEAFSASLTATGLSAAHSDFAPSGLTWLEHREWIRQEICKHPFPLAVLCSNDFSAAEVIDVCMQSGVRIPDQVAIMGIGNFEPVCETLAVQLSSVDINQVGHGEQAAALLARCMNGENPSLTPYRVPSLGVIVRASSDIYAVAHPNVARAVRYIHKHFASPISLPYIVEASGLSRQGLNKAFRQHLGRTPGEELRRVRLREGRRLLIETDFTLNRIAEKTGYSSANSFCIVFKRAFGHTPSKLRK